MGPVALTTVFSCYTMVMLVQYTCSRMLHLSLSAVRDTAERELETHGRGPAAQGSRHGAGEGGTNWSPSPGRRRCRREGWALQRAEFPAVGNETNLPLW